MVHRLRLQGQNHGASANRLQFAVQRPVSTEEVSDSAECTRLSGWKLRHATSQPVQGLRRIQNGS